MEEKDWKRWRCDLGFIQDEDPGDHVKTPQPSKVRTPGRAAHHKHTLSLFMLFHYAEVTNLTHHLIFQGVRGD